MPRPLCDVTASSIENNKILLVSNSNSGTSNCLDNAVDAEKGLQARHKTPGTTQVSVPEGGLHAWLSVAGASGVMFCTFGMTQTFGVFQDYYTRVLLHHHSPSTISWIGSLQVFLLYGLGLFAGKWFDDGYFHQMVIPGILVYLISFFMLSLCKTDQYYQFFLSQGLGMGIGMGLITIPTVSIVSHYFQARRALAVGIVFSGTSLGGILWPIMLNRLIQGKIGFAWGVRIAAFICLGIFLLVNVLIRPRFIASERQDLRSFSTAKLILADWNWGMFLFGVFIASLGISFPIVFLQLFASLHGVPEHITQYTLAILFASGTAFGRIIPGLLADRFGALNVLIAYGFISGGLTFVMFKASNSGGLIAFAIVYGPCSGGFTSVFPAALPSYAKTESEFGLRLGITGFVYGIGILVGGPITGALLQAPNYDWTISIVFSGVAVLLGCGIMFASRQILARRKGTQKI